MKKHFLLCTIISLIICNLISSELTLYQNNIGLLNQSLDIELNEGLQRYIFDDIPETIYPNSVILNIKDKNVEIFEQYFNSSFSSKEELIRNSIGEEIALYTVSGDRHKGVLIMYDRDFLTIKESTKSSVNLIAIDKILNIEFEMLDTDPLLSWSLLTEKNGSYKADLSFLFSNANWSVTYNAIWDEDNRKLYLNSWITINNETRYHFQDVKLNLFAGDINQDNHPQNARTGYASFEKSPVASIASDYYQYSYPQTINLSPYQSKELVFLEHVKTTAENRYEYKTYNDKVKSVIYFRNTELSGLGKPLPMGKVNIYSQEQKGVVFIGEDKIDHTSIDEEISLTSGYAFDLKAETIVMEQRKESNKVYEKDIKIVLKNYGIQTKNMSVIHNINGYWEIKQNSLPYHKRKANQIEFSVNVNPSEIVELTWTERVEH